MQPIRVGPEGPGQRLHRHVAIKRGARLKRHELVHWGLRWLSCAEVASSESQLRESWDPPLEPRRDRSRRHLPATVLLETQRLDRVELGPLPGGIEAEEDADDGGESDRNRDRFWRHAGRPLEELGEAL